MKKILIGAALAAGYIILCRLARGYWALAGDAIVIIMATAAYLALTKGVQADHRQDEKEPLPVKVARNSGGIRRVDKHVENREKISW